MLHGAKYSTSQLAMYICGLLVILPLRYATFMSAIVAMYVLAIPNPNLQVYVYSYILNLPYVHQS